MIKGIDVSHNNGKVDWDAVKRAGFKFAMIRVGYGKSNLDREFYRNANGALSHGLQIGIYHYSYALNNADAEKEAAFVIKTLTEARLTANKVIGIFYDMEDADGYKARHGMPSRQALTNFCSIAVNKFWKHGYVAGVYCNKDWYCNKLYFDQLGGCALWLAEPGKSKPSIKCAIWQYSFKEIIAGKTFDGDVLMK